MRRRASDIRNRLQPSRRVPKRRGHPPRRVQAPKRRDVPTGNDGWTLSIWAIPAGITAVAAAGLVVALALGYGGRETDPAKVLVAAGCTFEAYPSQHSRHLARIDAKINYNSDPPSSGPHYATPAIWGRYPSPVAPAQAVHNLEHGGIAIQYGSDVPQASIDRLKTFYNDSPNGLLMAPLPRLKNEIALTAWTHNAFCTRFSQGAMTAFRDAYRGKGPEKIPLVELKPGT